MTGPNFHTNWIDCGGQYDSRIGEHLHYRCVCGYDTTRPTRDVKKSQDAS